MLKIVIAASQIKHYMCITNINQILLFRGIVTLQSDSHALHIYIYIYIVGKVQRFVKLKKVYMVIVNISAVSE